MYSVDFRIARRSKLGTNRLMPRAVLGQRRRIWRGGVAKVGRQEQPTFQGFEPQATVKRAASRATAAPTRNIHVVLTAGRPEVAPHVDGGMRLFNPKASRRAPKVRRRAN
jgi:hypothetical protein